MAAAAAAAVRFAAAVAAADLAAAGDAVFAALSCCPACYGRVSFGFCSPMQVGQAWAGIH